MLSYSWWWKMKKTTMLTSRLSSPFSFPPPSLLYFSSSLSFLPLCLWSLAAPAESITLLFQKLVTFSQQVTDSIILRRASAQPSAWRTHNADSPWSSHGWPPWCGTFFPRSETEWSERTKQQLSSGSFICTVMYKSSRWMSSVRCAGLCVVPGMLLTRVTVGYSDWLPACPLSDRHHSSVCQSCFWWNGPGSGPETQQKWKAGGHLEVQLTCVVV